MWLMSFAQVFDIFPFRSLAKLITLNQQEKRCKIMLSLVKEKSPRCENTRVLVVKLSTNVAPQTEDVE